MVTRLSLNKIFLELNVHNTKLSARPHSYNFSHVKVFLLRECQLSRVRNVTFESIAMLRMYRHPYLIIYNISNHFHNVLNLNVYKTDVKDRFTSQQVFAEFESKIITMMFIYIGVVKLG